MIQMHRFALALLTAIVAAAPAVAADAAVGERVQKLTRATQWRSTASIPINFKTQHPQGMVRIGDTFFVSSVERAYFMPDDDKWTLFVHDAAVK